MKKKRTDCKYCGKELDAKTTRKEFCSNKCRVYWNRENPVVQITDATKPTNEVKPPEQPKTNYSIDTTQSQLPEKPDWMKQLELRRQQNKK